MAVRDTYPNTTTELRFKFYSEQSDGTRILFDPDAITVNIYDPSSVLIETHIYGVSSDLLRQATGIYVLSYTVPEDAETGTWTDVWTIVDGTNTSDLTGYFTVSEGSPYSGLSTGTIGSNTIYYVRFLPGIQWSDGTTLTSEQTYVFTGTLEPMYATVTDVRNKYGEYLTAMTDLGVSLAIHEASLIAQAMMPGTWPTTQSYINLLKIALKEYTVCKAAGSLLMNLIANSGLTARKRLGDLDITNSVVKEGGIYAPYSQAIKCYTYWELAIQTGGQHLDTVPPAWGRKGILAGDYIPIGRRIGRQTVDGDNILAYRESEYGILGTRLVWTNVYNDRMYHGQMSM